MGLNATAGFSSLDRPDEPRRKEQQRATAAGTNTRGIGYNAVTTAEPQLAGDRTVHGRLPW